MRQLTTIHTRQLITIRTKHLKIQHVQNTTVRKYFIQFPLFFPTHIVLTLSPQPFASHHFTTHTNYSHKVSFFPPFPTLHFTSFHFTTLLDDFHLMPSRYPFPQTVRYNFSVFPFLRSQRLTCNISVCGHQSKSNIFHIMLFSFNLG